MIDVLEDNLAAAKQVFRVGGAIDVQSADKFLKGLTSIDELAKGRFQIKTVFFGDNQQVKDSDLQASPAFEPLEKLLAYRSNLGDEGFKIFENCTQLKEINVPDSRITNSALDLLIQNNRNLQSLYISGSAVGDDGLKSLVGLKLHIFDSRDTQITDASMPAIASVARGYLRIHGSKITDDGLKHLAGVNLIDIGLDATAVTDTGLKHLEKLRGIQLISIKNTSITDQGIQSFLATFPDCKIEK